MSFSEQLQKDMAVFINTDEFAESVVYEAYGETAVTINAVVVRGEYTKQPTGYETYLIKSATLLVKASDLTRTPNPDGDIVKFDTDDNGEPLKWEVESFKPVGPSVAYKITVSNKTLISTDA